MDTGERLNRYEGEDPPHDLRLYRGDNEYQPRINEFDARLFCHAQAKGEEFFHRIAIGELFVSFQDENFCLNCAWRHGIVTGQRPGIDSQLGGLGIKPPTSGEGIPLAPDD